MSNEIQKNLLPNFISFLTSEKLTDCSIMVKKLEEDLHTKTKRLTTDNMLTEFKVHRIILSAQSPIFNSMFCNQFQEQNQHMIHLSNVDASIFKIFLSFCYSNEMSKSLTQNEIFNLYEMSLRFQTHKLTDLCSKNMINNLALDNAIDSLEFSLKYKMVEFEQKCLRLISYNKHEMKNQDEWICFIKNNPELTFKILNFL